MAAADLLRLATNNDSHERVVAYPDTGPKRRGGSARPALLGSRGILPELGSAPQGRSEPRYGSTQ